jgi:hypothetical protein
VRAFRPLAVFAAATIALTACGSGDGGTEVDDPSTAADVEGGTAAVGDDVAAVVNGDEIPTELLDARVDNAAETPELSQLLEGEEGDDVRGQLQASILSQLILNRIVLEGAQDMGLEIDDAAISDTRDQLVSEAGGEDAFEAQVAEAGLDDDQLASELESITALRLVRDELGVPDEAPTGPEDPAADPAQADPLQQWLVERLSEAEVAVAPELGTWNATQGQVVPPGLPEQPSGDAGVPAPPPDGATPSPAEPTTTAPTPAPDATASPAA